MSRLSEKDYEFLNALADGELDEDETRMWQARIDSQPSVRAAYDEILSVKHKLAGLGMQAQQPPANDVRHSNRRGRWAIAASVAAIIVAGALVFWPSGETGTPPQSIMAWHTQFSGQEYVVDQGDQPLFVSFGKVADIPIPDLTAWRLYLVDHQVLDSGSQSAQAVLHYRGLRGCRLTVHYATSAQLDTAGPVPVADGNFRHWLAGPSDISIIASGMDADRFRSIADYVETLTKTSADPTGKMRMAEAGGYAGAPPCAQT